MELQDYIEEVRDSLQDYPELNRILLENDGDEEHSNKNIEKYIYRALARINMEPPVTQFKIKNFPPSHWMLLVDGSVIEALQSKGLLKIRNDMNYQDQGGVNIQLDGKGQQYFQTSFTLYSRWKEDLAKFKNTISVSSAYGGVHSEYQRNWW